MKKLLTLFLLLGFVCASYSDKISVRVIINAIEVTSPDGETKTYYDPARVPDLEYASKIIAKGMTILNYHSVGIVLKNQQGLFISKDPLKQILIFSKMENTRSGPIVVTFDSTTLAQISADTIFSLKYDEEDNSVTLGIIDGNATMRVGDEELELTSNETFKHTFRGGTNDAV